MIKYLNEILESKFFFKQIILYFIDFIAFSISFYCFFYFTYQNYLLLFIIYFISLNVSGFYKILIRFLDVTYLFTIINALLIYFLCVVTLAWNRLFNVENYDIIINHLMVLFFFLSISRIVISKIINFIKKNTNINRQNIMIYGAGEAGNQLLINIINAKKYNVIGFLDDNLELSKRTLNNVKIFNPQKIKQLIKIYGNFEIIFAIPSISVSKKKLIIENLIKFNLNIRTLPNISEIINGNLKLNDIKNVEIDDLLSREKVKPDLNLLKYTIKNKNVLVTGSGGSIGSELSRQIILQKVKNLVLIDQNEFALFKIYEELKIIKSNKRLKVNIYPILRSILDYEYLLKTIKQNKINTIFHAAAHKHVALVEKNITEGIKNNIFGTFNLAKITLKHQVENFVLISTDKAVKPKNLMGATKRVSELILQAFAKENKNTNFALVRFGNVLGSSGSVVPIFKNQILNGGPLTVTSKNVTRYFMTISEAAELVIQAASLAKNGSIFFLDMGSPIKIYELAKQMILLSGNRIKNFKNEKFGIEIKITGLKKGEKLHEELTISKVVKPTIHPRIFETLENDIDYGVINSELIKLKNSIRDENYEEIESFFKKIGINYKLIFKGES